MGSCIRTLNETKHKPKKLNTFFGSGEGTHIRSAHSLYTHYTNRMPQTTYRLYDGSTRVSTAVKCKDGSILMVYPRKENFADVNLWKWVVEHEEDYMNLSLSLSTDSEHEQMTIDPPCPSVEPLSPYTPPLAQMNIDNLKLRPTVEDSGVDMEVTLTFTPRVSPRPEFQEPLPVVSPKSPSPCQLRQTADSPGYDSDDEMHRQWLIRYKLESLQKDLVTMSQNIQTEINRMDIRIKELIQKFD